MNRIHYLNKLAESSARYNLGAGVPPIALYPPLEINRLIHQFQAAHPARSLLQYHATEGLIRDLAVQTFAANEGHLGDHNDVLITNGVQEAIALAALHFREQPIACRDPFYPGLIEAVEMTGNSIHWIQGEDWLEHVAQLPQGTLFYLSSDFANPTGKSLSLMERQRLADLAEERGLFIFDDATYREFHLNERLPALFTFHPERIIHAMSFSKILAPGLRTAFVHLPSSLTTGFAKLKANLSLNNSGLTQAVVGGWLIEQGFELGSHLETIKGRLRENSQILDANGAAYEGGFFATKQMDQPIADLDWSARLLREEGVALCPMALFSERPDALSQVRLAVANISPIDLQRAMELIISFERT